MFGFGKQKKRTSQGSGKSESTETEKSQSEKEAEEKIVYFFLISTAIFGIVVLYLGISKEMSLIFYAPVS
ncbi:hypothetical protein AWM68_13020 [Fictibacillus phosphorivorans]|uniref:Uncharacterized protein n=1 Tax=Fictibacillus phosphorivorans TaxID=1221500 RepID=A0A165MZC5_9BACL|nr:hypothetical protein [Fictibacillus phosphorivorans]KZE64024.1 hypothetical protein AWM68_13020 [Fictibacillus phosphorivorans]